MFGISSDLLIIIFSALLAAGTVLAIALPLVLRSEKKQKYRAVIEKKRRDLFKQTRDETEIRGSAPVDRSAAQSLNTMYRLQKLAGNASIKARNLMLSAGIRNPKAPLYYLLARIALPVIFCLVAMMFLSGMESDLSEGVELMILGLSGVAGFYLPRILVKNTADKRQEEIGFAFPDSLDMMLICVQGGVGIEAAINKIADNVADHSEVLAEELGLLSAELGMLNDRKAAFMGFATRAGSGSARSFATAMLQAEQYGTSVSKAMRVLADEQRDARMAEAERKAASLPPKLTVPMILFFLPALFITILGPAFLQ
ncbi:MAG: type II secretion system F family protein [Pseudomonadota bacterium]